MNSFNYRIGWLEADFAVLRAKYENLDSRILEMESRLQKLEPLLRRDYIAVSPSLLRVLLETPAMQEIPIPEPETPLPALKNRPFSNCK